MTHDTNSTSGDTTTGESVLRCPHCFEEVWDGPHGHRLAKCWNSDEHEHGAPLAFDSSAEEVRASAYDRLMETGAEPFTRGDSCYVACGDDVRGPFADWAEAARDVFADAG